MNNLNDLQKVGEYLNTTFTLEEPWRQALGFWSLRPSPFSPRLGEARFMGEEVRPNHVIARFSKNLSQAELFEIRRHRPLGATVIVEDLVVDPKPFEKNSNAIGDFLSSFQTLFLTTHDQTPLTTQAGPTLAINEHNL